MSLFIGNIAKNVTAKDLHLVFDKFGKNAIDVKGNYAFVDFEQPRAAEQAKNALNGKPICGKEVKIEWSHDNRGALGYPRGLGERGMMDRMPEPRPIIDSRPMPESRGFSDRGFDRPDRGEPRGFSDRPPEKPMVDRGFSDRERRDFDRPMHAPPVARPGIGKAPSKGDIECYVCKGLGHMAKECKLQERNENGHQMPYDRETILDNLRRERSRSRMRLKSPGRYARLMESTVQLIKSLPEESS